MNKIFSLFFILIFNSPFLGQQSNNILFIGNSITYFNNMPDLFVGIANSKGKSFTQFTHAPGGTGFVNHYSDASLYSLIKQNQYQYVVMQPGSSESPGVSYPVSVTATRGKIIMDSIRKYSPCAKIFLYEIPYGVPSESDYNTYFTVQKKIKDSISKMANLMQVEIIPAGESAHAHYSNTQDLLLHGSYNDIHPNLNGSYLVASTIYSTLFQEQVTPSTFYGGITQNTAEYLQGIAQNTVLSTPNSWLMNVFQIHAGFNFNINNSQVNFNNTSANFDSAIWDFGDNTTAISTHSTHFYTNTGVYPVKLTVTKNGCTETITKFIEIQTLNTQENNFEKSTSIFPNPAKDFATIKSKKMIKSIEIYDKTGRLILVENKTNLTETKINLHHFAIGEYLLKITYKDRSIERKKLIKR